MDGELLMGVSDSLDKSYQIGKNLQNDMTQKIL